MRFKVILFALLLVMGAGCASVRLCRERTVTLRTLRHDEDTRTTWYEDEQGEKWEEYSGRTLCEVVSPRKYGGLRFWVHDPESSHEWSLLPIGSDFVCSLPVSRLAELNYLFAEQMRQKATLEEQTQVLASADAVEPEVHDVRRALQLAMSRRRLESLAEHCVFGVEVRFEELGNYDVEKRHATGFTARPEAADSDASEP